ncbi:hypothetical protein SEA_PANAMAXUS_49 [Mycobacterium phage Panamaxus]|uniref:Uncharacterized protein n=1 Tax=Mycobacterium phage Veracruz TaxID=2530154 RepID=A0A481VTB3_9CAUD|nr:hypothetical protein KIP27_gp42 [Mycobacterium phage Veracruz]AIS73724.1 hypothetical protein PBI_QUINNKIRO_50 [Mycobacterium phage QuinnKiro]AOT24200.1 hypothetical protein SEA_TODACORO_51 [Mycobacterium phage Todacoro]AUX82347.1 hypothetical protein SEA_LAMBERT1_51 [Mycobacterium phage Lambert1]AVP42968.1 hypothetical protein SEA_PANAMAXUS_49 [Mycobacterium phage Panamaxus]AWY03582.1 hypothetical protein SEA_HOOKMOUNT_51 [Mycobacterium phage Hookmount]AYR03430.1 hypothetical protein SEA_
MNGHNIMDATFNGMGGSELYRSLVAPDSFPDQKPMRIENWPEQERAMYCGGEEAKRFYRREIELRGAA